MRLSLEVIVAAILGLVMALWPLAVWLALQAVGVLIDDGGTVWSVITGVLTVLQVVTLWKWFVITIQVALE